MKIQLILLLISTNLFAQINSAKVSGYVYDKKNGEPIPFCNVFLKNPKWKTITDLDGYFKFDSIVDGTYTIVIYTIGYDSITGDVKVRDKATSKLKYYLTTSGIALSNDIPLIDIEPIYGDYYGNTISREEYNKMFLVDYLKRLKKDTIYEKEFISDPCNNNEQIKWKYFETGNLKHNKKTGDWIAYWNNGNLCYKAKYRQKLKLKKIPISKFVKDKKYPYGKYITSEKLKLRYWMIPIDTLIEYNLNGVLSKTVYFSKSGKILNDVINIYDDQGRLRLVRNLINNKSLEYCPHGFTSDQAEDSSAEAKRLKHSETCKWECYFDYPICPLEPVEGSKVVRAKF